MLLKRLLLTKDIEVFEIKKQLYGDVNFYFILIDSRRPSRYEDFSYISNFEKEDFNPRGNFIQALIIYNDKISEDEKELTYEIASGFLEDKDDCDWSLKYIKGDFNRLRVISVNPNALIEQVNELITSIQGEKKIDNIELNSFKYLFQE